MFNCPFSNYPSKRRKTGFRRPVHFTILGFGFVPACKKGSKNNQQQTVGDKAWKKPIERLKNTSRQTARLSITNRCLARTQSRSLRTGECVTRTLGGVLHLLVFFGFSWL